MPKATLPARKRSSEAVAMLPPEELGEALSSPRRGLLAVQARWRPDKKRLSIVLGDGAVIQVPLSRVLRSTSPTKANPRRLRLIDFGQTLCLGDFQVAVDALLPAVK